MELVGKREATCRIFSGAVVGEGVEGAGDAVFENDFSARDPVGNFSKDEVAEDVVGAESVGAVVSMKPIRIEPDEECMEDVRGSTELVVYGFD